VVFPEAKGSSAIPVRHKSVDEYIDFHVEKLKQSESSISLFAGNRRLGERSESMRGKNMSAKTTAERIRRIGPACVIGVDVILQGKNAWPCSLRTIKNQSLELCCISAEAILRLIGQLTEDVKEHITCFWSYTRLRAEATKELMFPLFPPVVDHEADTIEQVRNCTV
jgi:hypothetical protein